MRFDKIWLTKRGLWRCNVYYGNDLYDELSDIDLLSLIQKLKDINYRWAKIDFKWFVNIKN